MTDILTCEIKDGSSYYYKNGKLHREDGPAICNKEDKERFPDTFLEKNYTLIVEVPALKSLAKVLKKFKMTSSNGIMSYEPPERYFYSTCFMLEGIVYSPQNHKATLLSRKLQAELNITSKVEKKIKI